MVASVEDYTSILAYLGSDKLRWNGAADLGTQVVVTYSFTETANLPTFEQYGTSTYWSFSAANRIKFQEVLTKFEAVSGVKFVETSGTAMINVHGASGASAGGWANYSYSEGNSGYSGQGKLVNNYGGMNEGQYGYFVNLHELGHAMGLKHPHDGGITLDHDHDHQDNSVMTYNISSPYATELGAFDLLALQHLYGSADSFDGWSVSVSKSNAVVIKATDADETLLATSGANRMFSYGGDDVLQGMQGNDMMHGGIGDDTLKGGRGDDILKGGRDADFLDGMTGNDILKGGLGSDTAIGGYGSDTIKGGKGKDILIGDMTTDDNSDGGSLENDHLFGEAGDDKLYGGQGDDTLNGGEGNDVLRGGTGRDTLDGGAGDDQLFGGANADTLTGGAGADLFVFENADANSTDKVTDFTSGEDKIDLSDFGFLTFNTMNIAQSGADTQVSYSTWFDVELEGFSGTLTETDFIFV